MSELKVIYCGGIMGGENCGYISPQKSNVDNIVQSWDTATGTSVDRPKNETDADAYIFETNGTDIKLHVFRTCCSPTMTCTYNDNIQTDNARKIISDNTYIWKKIIYEGQDIKTIVMADYDNFGNPEGNNSIRIGSYGSGEYYEGFANPYKVEFSFINVGDDNDIPSSTNPRMFKEVDTLVSCDIPCQMRNISEETFYGCSHLTGYTNPDWFETIGTSAFTGCALQTIKIGRYTKISGSSFANCTSATTIDWCKLGESDVSCMKDIPPYAFHNCTMLKNSKFSDKPLISGITIPTGITGISEYAFSECSSIENLKLNEVRAVGDYAFYNCTSLDTVDTSNLASIGNHAFEQVSVNGDINADIIGEASFSGATINGKLNIIGTYIGNYAFAHATFDTSETSYTDLELQSVKNFGCGAFYETNVTSVILGTALNDYISVSYDESCGNGAFEGCTSLTSVTFNCKAYLGKNAFSGIAPLTVNIYGHNEIERWLSSFNDDYLTVFLRDFVYDSSGTIPPWVQYYKGNNWEGCVIKDANGTTIYNKGQQQ